MTYNKTDDTTRGGTIAEAGLPRGGNGISNSITGGGHAKSSEKSGYEISEAFNLDDNGTHDDRRKTQVLLHRTLP